MNTKMILTGVLFGAMMGIFINAGASDHDDGEIDLKGRSLNLTDLYVFREDWQSSNGSEDYLTLIMNTNPRSMARQQYYFSTNARYEFHLTRVNSDDKATAPTGIADVTLRFEFSEPNSTGNQAIQLTAIRDGQETVMDAGVTTSIADASAGNTLVDSSITEEGLIWTFAGLREDPFFFDVERYFRVRGLLATNVNTLGDGPTQATDGNPQVAGNVFRSDATAVDFTAGYNVNSIVVKVPISFLQSADQEPVFDVWETISVKQ